MPDSPHVKVGGHIVPRWGLLTAEFGDPVVPEALEILRGCDIITSVRYGEGNEISLTYLPTQTVINGIKGLRVLGEHVNRSQNGDSSAHDGVE